MFPFTDDPRWNQEVLDSGAQMPPPSAAQNLNNNNNNDVQMMRGWGEWQKETLKEKMHKTKYVQKSKKVLIIKS